MEPASIGDERNTVWKLLRDLASKKGITEISINDARHVFVEREGKFIQLNVPLSKADIKQFILDVAKFNNREIGVSNPILDGNLPDGSRINAILEPYAKGSPAISIRKYLKTINNFHSSQGVFGLYGKWIEFLKAAVAAKLNIVVAGGTGAGKTTLLNLLLQEISPEERVITIEDTFELSFKLPNVVRLEASKKVDNKGKPVTMQALVKNTLRMRPDRIVIGEVRGGELFDLLQAMNTGHDGSMCTIHANSPVETLQRMETLFLLAGHDVPTSVVRRQMASAIDFIVQIQRTREGKRIVSSIQEVTGMEQDVILTQTIAEWGEEDEALQSSGITPKNIDKLHYEGGIPKDFFT